VTILTRILASFAISLILQDFRLILNENMLFLLKAQATLYDKI
jgi:hypothetical protein